MHDLTPDHGHVGSNIAIADSSTVTGSALKTANSASFPDSSEPFLSSSKVRSAPFSVEQRMERLLATDRLFRRDLIIRDAGMPRCFVRTLGWITNGKR